MEAFKGVAQTLDTACNQAVIQKFINNEIKVANCVTPDGYLQSGKRSRDSNGKSVLTSVNERTIRRLTPIECERLQGLPDNHTKYGIYDGVIKEISNSQRYRLCGNGVSEPMVRMIAKKIKQFNYA